MRTLIRFTNEAIVFQKITKAIWGVSFFAVGRKTMVSFRQPETANVNLINLSFSLNKRLRYFELIFI